MAFQRGQLDMDLTWLLGGTAFFAATLAMLQFIDRLRAED
jgi:hypothetical protein